MIKTYSELIRLPTFEDRFRYLRLRGQVGSETFGIERYLNQKFYRSVEWKNIRDYVILRDNGCDLAVPDRDIQGRIIIHHMNPIILTDILEHSTELIDPEYLITTCHDTHNAIHYGDLSGLQLTKPVERMPNDMSPWRSLRKEEK
jgi:hypothetical protein